MRLIRLSVENFRSIKARTDLRVEPLQALVGENNAGKSNFLRALDCFLSSGAGGMQPQDFYDQNAPAMIEAEFGEMSENERRRLRSYLIGDSLILQKQLVAAIDERTNRLKVNSEYHGYRADPKDWWLSVEKIIDEKGNRPKWKEIAEEYKILDYVQREDGGVNKASYTEGLTQLLLERDDIEYDEPELGDTQALGLQQNLLAALPEFYLLPAITDYSDEIDRRSSSTVFRRLMADLADRIMRADPRYSEIEETLTRLHQLFNPPTDGQPTERLGALGNVETALRDTIQKLMPSVQGVQLSVQIDDTRDVFSKGVELKVDDGVLTDVLVKGHGMQRSIVFSLLQMLIKGREHKENTRPIILGIEEPELYIHPHTQRLIYRVLKDFAGFSVDDDHAEGTDQVIYTTHAPAFIEVSRYERIGVVRKDFENGTTITQCDAGVLGGVEERKGFKLLTSFGLKHNEMFFSRSCILVEGPEDEVGVIATARKLGRIIDLPDEIGLSIVVTDGKGDIPKFQKVLNAFGFSYGVLLELDGNPQDHKQSAPILENVGENRVVTIPDRLENLLGLVRHFDDQRHAKLFFSDPNNINNEMENLVNELLPPNQEAI